MNAHQLKNTQLPIVWTVYILRCSDQSLYTGITNHLDQRLAAHQAGVASRYTRAHLPVTLVYSETTTTRSQATKRELEIKKLTRQQKLHLIAQQTL